VAVTAFARAEDRARALKAGYQRHIAKPFHMKDILTAVAEFSRRRYVPRTGGEGPSA
jgi:CheY-like chemotaxis protein